MIFFRTPLQKRILQNYWENQKPFTMDSLCEQKVVKSRPWGNFAVKMMLKKHQIMKSPAIDGGEQFIGTTDSKEEWTQLLREKKLAKNPLIVTEDFGLSGLNKYEKTAAVDEMIELIEKKKREICVRANGGEQQSYR